MIIKHIFGGGVYIKETLFEPGEYGEKHTHDYDHLSTLVFGTVRVLIDGEAREITGPQTLTIVAGKKHQVQAITGALWQCIHATDCTNPDEVDSVLIGGS